MQQPFTEQGSASCSSPSPPASTEQTVEEPDMAKFYMSEYMIETMKMLYMMRCHHMLTDVVVQVESELFHAHKVYNCISFFLPSIIIWLFK